jgi:hypothetical protein
MNAGNEKSGPDNNGYLIERKFGGRKDQTQKSPHYLTPMFFGGILHKKAKNKGFLPEKL